MVSAAAGSCILYNKHAHQMFVSDNCTLSHDWCHYGQEIIQLKFEEIILSILRDTSQTESTSPFLRKSTKECVDARAQILRTSSEPWDVPRMADLVNLCPSRFHKLYTSIFGISPQADLIRMRLEHAELLLLQNLRYTRLQKCRGITTRITLSVPLRKKRYDTRPICFRVTKRAENIISAYGAMISLFPLHTHHSRYSSWKRRRLLPYLYFKFAYLSNINGERFV